jgi:hypothetical protein
VAVSFSAASSTVAGNFTARRGRARSRLGGQGRLHGRGCAFYREGEGEALRRGENGRWLQSPLMAPINGRVSGGRRGEENG